MHVLGLMSGTSLDGVDAAVIETDGERVTGYGAAATVPLTEPERAAILALTDLALAGERSSKRMITAEDAVHASHLRAIAAVTALGAQFELVGFHGQTILHRPEQAFSWQVGDAARLAETLDVPVVSALRDADLAAGGLGAPLVPIYHQALYHHTGLAEPCAFLNIGGIANLTVVSPAGPLYACDTGPGNGMMDLLLQTRGEARYDDGGRIAALGRIDAAALAALLADKVLAGTGPRALDRYDIGLDAVMHLATPDALATLVAFTAECVARAAGSLPVPVSHWYVCGGGRHNPTLMQELRRRLGHCESIDTIGARGDFVEAEAMAYLALRSVQGKPITFPGTTNVKQPTTGGTLFAPVAGRNADRMARA